MTTAFTRILREFCANAEIRLCSVWCRYTDSIARKQTVFVETSGTYSNFWRAQYALKRINTYEQNQIHAAVYRATQ